MKHEFKSPPMDHQVQGLKKAWPRNEFAFFWEMGAGKTFAAINLAAARFNVGQIKQLLVICPTAIKSVWWNNIDGGELEKFCPIPYEAEVMRAGYQPRFESGGETLRVLIVGVESLSTKHSKAYDFAWSFVHSGDTMVCIDESSRIKNHKSNRTKRCIHLGGLARYRAILTGTPVTQGLQDLYSQFAFLNGKIIGCKSYFVFQSRYCLTIPVPNGPRGAVKIVGYQLTDELFGKIRDYTDIVKKEDCMDLPPKIYEKMTVEPTKEQKQAYRQLHAEYAAQQADKEITVDTVMTRMTRIQQVVGGTFPYDSEDGYDSEPIQGANPKLAALAEILDEVGTSTKCIIWCRFRPEIRYVVRLLSDLYGPESVVEYHGGIDEDDRTAARIGFQGDDSVRFFVANQQTGGYGLTLTAATLVVYFSNTFSYEDRRQSEDRCHRRGQTNKVTYIDIEMNIREDRMILQAINKKKNLATLVEEELK